METLVIRPKSDFMQVAAWDSLYALTEHWKSDMDFFKDEINFLDILLGKYFIWLTRDDNVHDVQPLLKEVDDMRALCKGLASRVDLHLLRLSHLIENAFSHDEQAFRDEHEKLENDLASFTGAFRNLKQKVFGITKKVMETERIQHLLS
ncbi:MAG: hypothetical protein KDD36_13460 [Flavobacteriales bacterium]|nr:hypothetical protein [Flavobacteriales bacterium]